MSKATFESCDTQTVDHPSHNNEDSVKPIKSPRCLLLELPAEIRFLIYEYLPFTWKPRPQKSYKDFDILRMLIRDEVKKSLPYIMNCGILGLAYTERSFDPAILLTCWDIYREAQPVLYRTLVVHARFKDPESLEQTIRTLIDSPFRYIRAFGFSIRSQLLSELPTVSLTLLKKILEGMPYLERVDDITVEMSFSPETSFSFETSSPQESDAVANLIELNKSSKPISRVIVSGGRPDKVRFSKQIGIHSIPVAMAPRMKCYARTREVTARHKLIYAEKSEEMQERISKLRI